MGLKAVIFDLDGTLIDSAPDMAAAINRFLQDHNFPTLSVDLVEKFTGKGPRQLISDVLSHVGQPTDEENIQRALKTYLKNYTDNPANHTVFYNNVLEDLDALKEHGIRMGICTNKPQEITVRVLDQLKIARYFEFVCGSDAVEKSKPDPAHLLTVSQQMKLKAQEWVYVGDSLTDQETALRAKVPFYAVPWGNGSDLKIESDYRLNRIIDLLDLKDLKTKWQQA